MQHLIIVGVSQEAQKAAARAGAPAAAVQSIPLLPELIGRALDLGAEVAADGSVVLTYGRRAAEDGWRTSPAPLSEVPRDAAHALDLIQAAGGKSLQRIEDEKRAAEKAQEAAQQVAANAAKVEAARPLVAAAVATFLAGGAAPWPRIGVP
ncbi:MAG: hypothetical protein V1755_14730, partial [Chloroflexota bacterium]